MTNEKVKILIFVKDETMLDSIISDIFSFSLAAVLLFASWLIPSCSWIFVSIFLLILTLGGRQVKSKWVKLKNKKEAIEWANGLEND